MHSQNKLKTGLLKNKWHLLAILSLAYGFFLVGLDRLPVPTVDGAVRASMARHIVNTGNLWPIVYENRVFTDHPPLFLWLTALSFKLFGITDFAANLVPRLFAALTVFLTGALVVEAGFSAAVGLASAIILCLTRDFVLSSVRGYIEPVLECFIYLGLWFVFAQRHRKKIWPALGAGISVWLAAYSKGPVALWPFLFFAFLLFWNGQTRKLRTQLLLTYLGGFVFCTLLWMGWVEHNQYWPYWKRYWFEQILGSALHGRGGAQQFEPFFFLKILFKFYIPWNAFLVLAIVRLMRSVSRVEFSRKNSYSLIFFIFGLGFVGGFSLMKWKFWYYIAPAYPAFACFIALEFSDKLKFLTSTTPSKKFAYVVSSLMFAWILIGSLFAIPLHRERVPEVMEFKDLILSSNSKGPVWFLHCITDHNMVGTSGNWYFNRNVFKVKEEEETEWEASRLQPRSWIITDVEFFKQCQRHWCKKSRLVKSFGKSALVFYE